jgi:hypothetical protein
MFENGVSFFWKDAGLFSVWWGTNKNTYWAFHLIPGKDFWLWGVKQYWMEGEVFDVGFGPLFRIVKISI